MFFDRTTIKHIKKTLISDNKIVILLGARQTGKTTLSNHMLDGFKGRILRVNADESKYIELFSSRDYTNNPINLAL